MFAIVHNQSNNVLFLVFLGGNDYPWEIVGVDFDTYKSSKFNFAAIIDSCLPSDMAQFLSCY
jgi:hypothetical protein